MIHSGQNVLPAIQHKFVSYLLEKHSSIILDLMHGLGSPLHFLFPEIFEENVASILSLLRHKLGINAQILFAKKANKANCYIQSAAKLGIGVDVASEQELTKALGGGIQGSMIGVSGPEKSHRLITLALHHDCMIAVDSLNELERLKETANELEKRARILLRCQIQSHVSSRFGFSEKELQLAIIACSKYINFIDLQGFSFHLSGYSTSERTHAANTLIDHCLYARTLGMSNCRNVDIGGGLPVQYVNPLHWAEFLKHDMKDHYHAEKKFTDHYPYGIQRPILHALEDIFTTKIDSVDTLISRAKTNNINYILEPGRALLNQAGFTVFRIQQVKDRHEDHGYAIATVQGTSFSLSEQWFNSEFLPDPVHLTHDNQVNYPQADASFFVSIAGISCLENDMISWRKIPFSSPLLAGDFLIYLNTAGYQMDSNESSFHEIELPRKVVLQGNNKNTDIRWHLDGLDDK